MATQQEHLEKLLAAINDLERRLRSIELALFKNEEEINTLVTLEDTLVDNLFELKKEHVIAMAHEYKKAKEDLKKTKTRLAFLRIDRVTYERAFKGQSGLLDHLKRLHVVTIDRMTNNVIKGNFGKKNGR